jgi:hypothetical protein
MADFARVLAAIDRACPGLTGGRALELFAGQRERIASEVVESDEVAAAVARLMESRDKWTGTAGELLKVLTPEQPSAKTWPKNARALSGRLRRVRPALEAIGIRHTPPKDTDKTRTHMLERTGSQPPEPPDEPPTDETSPAVQAMEDAASAGGVFGGPPDDRPSVNGGEALAAAGLGDSGGTGGTSPLLSFYEEDGWERGEV